MKNFKRIRFQLKTSCEIARAKCETRRRFESWSPEIGCKSGDCLFHRNYFVYFARVHIFFAFVQNKSCLAKRFPAAAHHSPAAPSCARQRPETMTVQRLMTWLELMVKWNPYLGFESDKYLQHKQMIQWHLVISCNQYWNQRPEATSATYSVSWSTIFYTNKSETKSGVGWHVACWVQCHLTWWQDRINMDTYKKINMQDHK